MSKDKNSQDNQDWMNNQNQNQQSNSNSQSGQQQN